MAAAAPAISKMNYSNFTRHLRLLLVPQISLNTPNAHMGEAWSHRENKQRFWSIVLWATLLFLSYCDHPFTTPGRVIGTHGCNSCLCETILITCHKSLCVTGCCKCPSRESIKPCRIFNTMQRLLFFFPLVVLPAFTLLIFIDFTLIPLFLSVCPDFQVQTMLLLYKNSQWAS